jgi:anti-anti-sigma factor
VPLNPDFRIETRESGTGREIRVTGELDSATCETLAAQFERVAERAAGAEVVVDLQGVSFVDSAGIRTMVLMQRTAAERGVTLLVVRPPESVLELLRVAGVADRMTLSPAPDDAPADVSSLEHREVKLPREPTAPARARAEVRRTLGDQLAKSALEAVTLLTSELVTNAVIHPQQLQRDVITLKTTSYPDRVRVEVSDSGTGFDPTGERLPRETGGRGLVLVDAIARRWGTRRSDPEGRFTVWFELCTAEDRARAMAACGS